MQNPLNHTVSEPIFYFGAVTLTQKTEFSFILNP